MRPIKLKFTAFGPYADTQAVDFTKMEASSMFVITGPTGSGKTTIFDAMSFALYGSASGSDRQAEMFRSEFADDDVQTEVEFSFELRNEVYSIVRKPSQMRPKKRGEGYTKVESSVILTYQDKIYSAQSETNAKISELLGLTKEQFKQIVLLPQGEFKKLLMSDSKSKEEIFRKIFNTSHIKNIQDKLRQNSSELKRQIEDTELQVNTILNNYSPNTTKTQLEYLHPHIKQNLVDLDLKGNKISDKIESYSRLLEAEVEYKKNLQTLQKIDEEIKVLESETEKYQQIRVFLKQIENVTSLKFSLDNLKELELNIASIKTQIEKLRNSGNENQKQLQLLSPKLLKVTEEYENLDVKRNKLNSYQDLLVTIEDQTSIKDDITKALTQVPPLKNVIEVLNEEIAQVETNINKATDVVQEIEAKKIELDVCNKKLEVARIQLESVKSIEELNADIKASITSLQSNQLQLEIENSHLNGMRSVIISAQAGKLANDLKDEEPCPVCGSLHHPKLAIVPDVLPTEEELTKQEQLTLELNSKISSLITQNKVKKEQISKIMSDHNLDESEDYNQKFEKITNQYKKLENKIASLNSMYDLNNLISNKEHLQAKLTETRIKLENINTNIKVNQSRITLDEKTLNKKDDIAKNVKILEDEIIQITNMYTSLKEKDQNLKVSIKADLAKVETLEEQLLLNNENVTKVQQTIDDISLEIGEENVNRYISMLDNANEYKISLTKYDEKIVRSKTLKLNIQQSVANYSPIDEQKISIVRLQLQNEIVMIQNLIDIYKVHDVNITRDLKALNKIDNSYQKLSNEYKIVADLSDIANGKTISKISFERYMLANYFKQIINRANIYFKKMTNNRFELIHKETGRGNASRGLDLNIIDNYTTSIRDVKSLSGGESFKAALAMALGLSDIVQMNSGGIQIDTIFIDEGFGSLDIDSLNMAIDTLINIQNEGRMVGIISHVEELKNQIPNKIEITPSQKGSKLVTKFN